MVIKLFFAVTLLMAGAAGESIEKGRFVLHKFARPIGEETYEITRDGDSLITNPRFQFVDRGGIRGLGRSSGAVQDNQEICGRPRT
jgi:hypothetical protein